MSQMTYRGTGRMSAFGRDIRPLSRHSPGGMLRGIGKRSGPSITGLEFCLVCGRDFVSMVRCTSAGSGSWWLVLRCGDCGTWHETLACDDAVAALQRGIARGLSAIAERLEWSDLDLVGPNDL